MAIVDPLDRAHVQTRRGSLAAQLDRARAEYDRLEATLHTLDRQLCAMAGGLQELDALLEQPRDLDRDQGDKQADGQQRADDQATKLRSVSHGKILS